VVNGRGSGGDYEAGGMLAPGRGEGKEGAVIWSKLSPFQEEEAVSLLHTASMKNGDEVFVQRQ
jgi:hypothetical protein